MLAGVRQPLLRLLSVAVLVIGAMPSTAHGAPAGHDHGGLAVSTTQADADLHYLVAAMVNQLRHRVAACSDPLGADRAEHAEGRAASGALVRTARPELRSNRQLTAAAMRQARMMADSRQVSHRSMDGTTVRERSLQAGYRWRVIGENLAAGQRSIAEVLAQWLASASHCDNLLDERFTEFGVARAWSGGGADPGRVYWALVMGKPK